MDFIDESKFCVDADLDEMMPIASLSFSLIWSANESASWASPALAAPSPCWEAHELVNKLCKSWASQVSIKGTMSVFSCSTAYLKLLCCITQLIGSEYSSQRKWSHLQENTTQHTTTLTLSSLWCILINQVTWRSAVLSTCGSFCTCCDKYLYFRSQLRVNNLQLQRNAPKHLAALFAIRHSIERCTECLCYLSAGQISAWNVQHH